MHYLTKTALTLSLAGMIYAFHAPHVRAADTTGAAASPTTADAHPPASSSDAHPPTTSSDTHPPTTSSDAHPPATSSDSHPSDWQLLLAKAEPLYVVADYRAVLPIYEEALAKATAAHAPRADQIQCLRYVADVLCRLERPDEALAKYEQADALLVADDIDARVANLNDEALCWGQKEDASKAESLCHSAVKLCTESKGDHNWELARTQAQLAYIDYVRAKYLPAIAGFHEAELTLEKCKRSDMIAELLRQKLIFATAGSYYHLRRFDDAYLQFKRLYECDVPLFGKADLQTGWSMLALSDVLGKLNKQSEADEWYRKAIYIFRKFNADRLCKEYASKAPPGFNVQERINSLLFGNSNVPADLQDDKEPLCKDSSKVMATHDPRSLYARPFDDAPGLVWVNPFVKSRGVVIAIHGLSLEHHSYDAFARELADAGFATAAFDMRGFGAYRQALGAEQLDFEGCIHDLKLVVTSIRANNPTAPLFMLGESMGGAIALQFTAQNPQLVDGLIASVPAGKRFNQKLQAVKVALRFLGDKNRPFDIGSDVINQATHDPRVKEEWASDSKTRSRISPRELVAFQAALNRNLQYAKQIHSTPVVIFQGVSDMLVKPEATYDLFRSIVCKDKSFIMVGNAEHLIFEEGCFTQSVLKGLVAWMESHSKTEQAASSK